MNENLNQPNEESRPAWLQHLIAEMKSEFDAIKKALRLNQQKDRYTVEEAAEFLNRSPYTVREYCRLGIFSGAEKVHGKGRKGEWRIPHDEVMRVRNEGAGPVAA